MLLYKNNLRLRLSIVFVAYVFAYSTIALLELLLDKHYFFFWSLGFLPAILFISYFPRWHYILFFMLILSVTKFILLLWIYPFALFEQSLTLFVSTFINFSLLMTIAYYRMKFESTQKLLRCLAMRDELTGVYNRHYFNEYADYMIKQANQQNLSLFALMMDVDKFKRLNDTYGHVVGDSILRRMAQLISDEVRKTDCFARFGGEEFVLFIPDTSIEYSELIAERIRYVVEQTVFTHQGKRIPVTISLGVTRYLKGDTLSTFIDRADQALYHSKNTGRNKVSVS